MRPIIIITLLMLGGCGGEAEHTRRQLEETRQALRDLHDLHEKAMAEKQAYVEKLERELRRK